MTIPTDQMAEIIVGEGLYHPAFPEHWSRSALYPLATWVNGLAFKSIQFSPTGKPVIKISEIKGGISPQTNFTEQRFHDSVNVENGALLFAWSGQPETSIDAYLWRGPAGWLNQHIFRVTPANEVDDEFFYYLLKYLRPTFVAIARNKQTTGLGHVTRHDLENLEVGLPSLVEQRAIAHVLGALDNKIEVNRRMNETLEEMARALFKSWFVDFEPVRAKLEGRWRSGESLPGLPADLYNLFPDRLVPSEMGKIPEGWEVRPLGEVVEQLRDNENPQASPDMAFSHFSIPAFDRDETPVREWGPDIKSAKTRIQSGVVLMSKLNPEIERVWLVDVEPNQRAVCSTEFLVLRALPPLERGYIYCLLRSPQFREQVESLVTGTSKSHQRSQAGAVLSLQVVIPPELVSHEFDKQASAFLAASLSHRREISTLATQRDVLLPKLVSGEVRVP